MQAHMRADPARYTSWLPHGPRGEIVSSMGYPHDVVLTKHGSGWRIASDQHDEVDLLGHSPDLVPGSWAAILTGRQSNGLFTPNGFGSRPPVDGLPHFARPLDRPLATYTYDYMGAVNYAHSYCDPNAGHPYNSAYCSWSCQSADCANFVSQCFVAGGQPADGSWYYNSGASCPACSGTGNRGMTNAWVNNASLRAWISSASRGVYFTSNPVNINNLGYGDVINYDWTTDGALDHVTLLTSPGNESVHVQRCGVRAGLS